MTMQPTYKGLAEALSQLESSHVQNNKHRMGALGAQNIDRAIAALRTARQEPKCPDCGTPLLYDCPGCSATNYPPATPASASEAVLDWEDGLLDGDSATLDADGTARYEVWFVISENHNGVWRAEFNPDTEAKLQVQIPLGTFATKREAQIACEKHAIPAPASGEGQQGELAEPLRVFSAGMWRYDGTGQSFSHEDLDAAAFVEYRNALRKATQQQAGQAVAIVGAFGSVSWMSEKILPIGTNLYTASNVYEGCPPSVLAPVLAELARATTKFPTWPTDPLHALAVLGEEFGEQTQAVLQAVYEGGSPRHVATEAIQTAAMALRFVMSLGTYRYQQAEQHQQIAASEASGGADSRGREGA